MGRPDQHSYADYLFRSGLPREEADRRASLAFDKESSSNGTPVRLGDKTTESIATTLAASMFGEDEVRDPHVSGGNQGTITAINSHLSAARNSSAPTENQPPQADADFTLPGDQSDQTI